MFRWRNLEIGKKGDTQKEKQNIEGFISSGDGFKEKRYI